MNWILEAASVEVVEELARQHPDLGVRIREGIPIPISPGCVAVRVTAPPDLQDMLKHKGVTEVNAYPDSEVRPA